MTRTGRRNQKGSALIELALVMPVLMLLLLGVADFGRVFYEGIALQGAARAGVQYGTLKSETSTDFSGMQRAALADIPNLTGATAAASRFCTCGWGNENDCSSGCSSQRMYLRVTVRKTFQTMVPYPGIPSSTELSATAQLRVQ